MYIYHKFQFFGSSVFWIFLYHDGLVHSRDRFSLLSTGCIFYYAQFSSLRRHFLWSESRLLGFSLPICTFCLLIQIRFLNFAFLLVIVSTRILLGLSKGRSRIPFGGYCCVVLVCLVLVFLELMQYCLFRILLRSGRSGLEGYMVYIVESYQILIHLFHHLNTDLLARQCDW